MSQNDTRELRYLTVVSQPFDENSYILHLNDSNECLIVDPGFEPDKITAAMQQRQLQPVAILNTHGHSDHIAGNAAMKAAWPDCPLVIGAGDADKLVDPYQNLSAQFGIPITSPAADQTVMEGDKINFADIELEVLETPGHSAGHVVFVYKQAQPWIVVGGDVLFQASIGRTDFPDGSFADLAKAIHQKLFVMPDETIVLPGHGPTTTVGFEKAHNPFVGASARPPG